VASTIAQILLGLDLPVSGFICSLEVIFIAYYSLFVTAEIFSIKCTLVYIAGVLHVLCVRVFVKEGVVGGRVDFSLKFLH